MNKALLKSNPLTTRSVALSLGTPRLWAAQTAFLAALCASSFIRVPLPFTPVPLTLQVFVVLLAALFLGGRASLPVVAGFLALGAAGLPVFSGGAAGVAHLFGVTGGYLMGFFVAAYFVGSQIGRGTSETTSPTFVRDAAILAIGVLIIHGLGALWLGAMTGFSFSGLLTMAVVPFLLIDAVKAATAYALYRVGGKAFERTVR